MIKRKSWLASTLIFSSLLLLSGTGCSGLPRQSQTLGQSALVDSKVNVAKQTHMSRKEIARNDSYLGQPSGRAKPILVSSRATSPDTLQRSFSLESSGEIPSVSHIDRLKSPARAMDEFQDSRFDVLDGEIRSHSIQRFAQVSPDAQPERTAKSQGEPDMAKLADKINNPLGDLWLLWTQNDTFLIDGDLLDESRVMNMFNFRPVLPTPINKDWNLINRVILQFPMVPIDENVGNLFGVNPGGGASISAQNPGLAQTLMDPFDNTTFGFGDMVYLGLVAPSAGDLGFLWGVGPTFIFPTASQRVLGQEKWQAGPAAFAGYFGPKWNLGVLPMQWWSFAGDDKRSETSQMNMQYFIQYKLGGKALWQIGMAPNIRVNWFAEAGSKYTVPIGIGVNRMVKFGKVPTRVAFEVQWFPVRPDALAPNWNFRIAVIPVVPNLIKFWSDL